MFKSEVFLYSYDVIKKNKEKSIKCNEQIIFLRVIVHCYTTQIGKKRNNKYYVCYIVVYSLFFYFFNYRTLSEALEKNKRKYQSRIRRLEQQIVTTSTTTTTTNQNQNNNNKSRITSNQQKQPQAIK